MNNNLNLCVIRTVTDGDKNHTAICCRITNSLANDGQTIYNGNDETIVVPCLREMRKHHASTWCAMEGDCDARFEGWHDMRKAEAIFFDRIKDHDKRDTLLAELVSPETYEMYNAHRDIFDNEDSAAIRVELRDGSWFEYIVSDTNEPDED